MKKKSLAALCALTMFLCGCTNGANNESEILLSETSSSAVSDISSIITEPSTSETPSETDINETDLEHAVRLATEFVEESHYNEGGLLHDFDLDGIPELVIRSFGLDQYVYYIFSLRGDTIVFLAEVNATEDVNKDHSLALYHDPGADEYFYIGENNFGGKGYGHSEVLKFQFYDNEIVKTQLSYLIYYYSNDSSDNNIYISEHIALGEQSLTGITKAPYSSITNDLAEYLSLFEKLEVIDFTPMWDYGDNFSEKIKEAATGFSDYSIKSEMNLAPGDNTENFIEFNGEMFDRNINTITITNPKVNSNIDLNELKDFPNLFHIIIYTDQFVDIYPLISMPNITYISLLGNSKIDYELLSKMPCLEYLQVTNADALDFIKELDSLTQIYVTKNTKDADYFTPLYSLSNLELVVINCYVEGPLAEIKNNMPNCVIVFL